MAKAGFAMLTDPSIDRVGLVNNVVSEEEGLMEQSIYSGRSIPGRMRGISHVMKNTSNQPFLAELRGSATRQPEIATFDKTQVQSIISNVQQEASLVQGRIDNAITEFGELSDQMTASLDEGSTLSITNPVSNTQDAISNRKWRILLSAPGFRMSILLLQIQIIVELKALNLINWQQTNDIEMP
ncbi:MAG: hypothetical protein U5K71_08930 [Gracilimonas sp.]|nr:hypothetical protein [Gracilimonas sp.]